MTVQAIAGQFTNQVAWQWVVGDLLVETFVIMTVSYLYLPVNGNEHITMIRTKSIEDQHLRSIKLQLIM
jgi:hypothetical protein